MKATVCANFFRIASSADNVDISVTGHSLGGNYAETVGAVYNVPCYSFNRGSGLPTPNAINYAQQEGASRVEHSV